MQHCEDLDRLNGGKRRSSPLKRLIALGWYDGPTAGVSECGKCGMVFNFELMAWDAGQTGRAFSLAPLPANAMQRIGAALTPVGEPSWPVWVPRWVFASSDERQRVETLLDAIMADASPVTYIVIAKDLLKTIYVRRVEPTDRQRIEAWMPPVDLANPYAVSKVPYETWKKYVTQAAAEA